MQGAALLAMLLTNAYPIFLRLAALLGAGTALVYPTFLAAVAEYAPLAQRAQSVGILPLLARRGLHPRGPAHQRAGRYLRA